MPHAFMDEPEQYGKKLSKLQKSVLKRAYENRQNTQLNQNSSTDLYVHEVLWYDYEFRKFAISQEDHLRTYPRDRLFSKYGVGEKRYRAALTAVSRTMRLLEKRGLIIRVNGA